MAERRGDKVDALAADIDDLKLTVEELQDEMSAPGDATSLATIERALEDTAEASDQLADGTNTDPWIRWAADDRETATLVAQSRVQFGPERINRTATEALEQAGDQPNGQGASAEAIFKALLQDLLAENGDQRR